MFELGTVAAGGFVCLFVCLFVVYLTTLLQYLTI
jgi:hypothetical protein